MSIDSRTRTLLLALSDADLIRLAEIDGLGHAWSQAAKIRQEDFARGTARALRAVRVAMLRDAALFAELLAHFSEAEFGAELDAAPEIAEGQPPTDFNAASLAVTAAHELGKPVARAFLSAVAGSDLAMAKEISERFDELVKVVDATSFEVVALEEEATFELAAHTPAVEPAQRQQPTELLRRTIELRAQGTELANELRAAADALAHGRPAEPGTEAADIWSEAVRAHLEATEEFGYTEDLTQLEERLRAVTEEMTNRSESARSALQTIDLLINQGLDDMVTEVLDRLGFSTVEEVRSLAMPADPAPPQEETSDALGTAPPEVAPIRDDPDRQEVDRDAEGGTPESVLPEAPSSAPTHTEPISQTPGTEDLAEPPPSATTVADDYESRDPAESPPCAATGAGVQEPIEQNLVQDRDPEPYTTSEREATIATANLPDAPLPPGSPATATDASATSAADYPALDEERLPDFPWDEGSPPLIARLILQDRYADAYYVALAADEQAVRQRLLKLACAAHCSSDVLELALSQLIPSEAEIDQLDTNEVRLLLAAALRISLTLGYAPLGLTSLVERADLAGTGLADVIDALSKLAQRGYRRRPEGKQHSEEDLATRWTERGAEAAALVGALRRKRTRYQRASRVLHHIVRETEPVGHALVTAAELTQRGIAGAADDQWAEIEHVARRLLDHDDRQHLINETDHQLSPLQQRRSPIEGGALSQLHDNLGQAGMALEQLLAVRRAIVAADDVGSIASVHDLNRALAEVSGIAPPQTVGDAALSRLLAWLQSEPVAPQSESLESELDGCLAVLYELPRDVEGRPTREPTAAEAVTLLTPRADDDVIAGYLACGNITAARAYIEARGIEGRNDDEILRATNRAQAAHQAALIDAERVAARLRALGEDEAALLVAEEIDAHRRPPRPDRFDLVIQPLEAIYATAEQDLEVVRQRLREQTAALDAPEDTKARILSRIGQGDEALAVEYLRDIQAGQPLPEVPDSRSDDFVDFYPRIVAAAAAAQSQGEDPVAAARKARDGIVEPTDQFKDSLDAWRTIKRDKRADPNAFRWSVAQVLRMVGLIPGSGGWLSEISRTQRAGFATFRVKATPVDRSYVPQFGTQAHGSYDVTFVWAAVSPRRLMDFIDDKNVNRPNIIFYFGVLDVDERRRLRNETLAGRGKGFSPLVIDEAVVGWLSTMREPGWRFTQRITLPFTTINPYTPFASGEVPDEVFVGRDEERRHIEDPTGSMFVYGGRQLGKSALLRRVERLFTDRLSDLADSHPRVGNVALYIDLKAQGIGESQEPGALWPVLGERLKSLGVISSKERASNAKEVGGQITKWLSSDTSNRLLLLLDEADNFMTADANAGAAGAGAFPVLQALKGIMESSQRRFKPIFAGLHQVQRFHDMSNTPVAHGGEDILIGPLKNSDAFHLVVDPMNALGYRFETFESVWRLLLVTNYQASLVQIVCDHLLKHVQNRPLPDGGDVRIAISEKDVQDVCADKSVRDLIEMRFRWTINLDSRYRVIALVVALNSLEEGPGRTLTVDEIREQCEEFWKAGFDPAELSSRQFERYLDEMIGLRILRRHEGRYGLRSPYIIQMLGSKDSLERELKESAKHLERPLEYNPTTARQIIGESTQVWSERSPLTDNDLALLLTADPEPPVQVVFGSQALGVDRVGQVLADAAKGRGFEVLVSDIPEAFEIGKRQFGKRTHLILDLSQAQIRNDFGDICAGLSGRRNLTATVIAGPTAFPAVGSLTVPVHKLRRWSVTELRAWYDSPFEAPNDRERLHLATSGWPKLVEEVMRFYSQGLTPDNALKALTNRMAEKSEARGFLEECAVDVGVATTWVEWFVKQDGDGRIIEIEAAPAQDVADVVGRSVNSLLEELDWLDVATRQADRWVLDRVVAAATINANK